MLTLNHLPKKDIIVKALKPLGEYQTSGGQIKYNCPICEKSGNSLDKFNLEIKIETGVFHCWCCHYKGSVRTLVKERGLNEFLHLFTNTKKVKIEEEVIDKDEKPFILPDHLMNVQKHEPSINYLISRGLTKEKAKERQIKFCYSGDMKGAIIFPSYNESGALTAYIAHFPKKKKYFTFKNKNFICFYSDFIDKTSPIALVEGLYDALVIPNSIPLLGTAISKACIEYLSNTSVIYIPDNDIKLTTQKECIKALSSVCTKVNQYKVSEEYKDINDSYIGNRLVLVKELYQFYSYE